MVVLIYSRAWRPGWSAADYYFRRRIEFGLGLLVFDWIVLGTISDESEAIGAVVVIESVRWLIPENKKFQEL